MEKTDSDLMTALNTPTTLMEVREFKSNEKETFFFNEKEIELGLKQKRKIREFISSIIDEPVKIIISSTFPPKSNLHLNDQRKLKTRALYLRTFLINQGISHNRISIKTNNKRNISKNWKNELTLIFVGT